MDLVGLFTSFLRLLFLPALFPIKYFESRLTAWEQMDERERKLNRRVAYLRAVAKEYGYEPAHWQSLQASTAAEIYTRNFLANISEAAKFLGQASQARRASQKYMTLVSLDAADRRLNSAVRIALVGLMNQMIPYAGAWSPDQRFPNLQSILRQDPVSFQATDIYERLATVVTLELLKVRGPYLDENGKRALAEYLNVLNAYR